jgi:hypothetical protein
MIQKVIKCQNVSFYVIFVDIFFLKGLYIEKVRDKDGFYGFSLYHDCEGFRKRMLFHKDEKVIDMWLNRLKYYC